MENIVKINDFQDHFKVNYDYVFNTLKKYSDMFSIKAMHNIQGTVFTQEEYFNEIMNQDIKIRESLLSKEFIIAEAKPHIPIVIDGPIVYFLVKDKEIVYVGQSVTGITRIADHVRNKDKVFNRVFILNVNIKDLTKTEEKYIIMFEPELNIATKGDLYKFELFVKEALNFISENQWFE